MHISVFNLFGCAQPLNNLTVKIKYQTLITEHFVLYNRPTIHAIDDNPNLYKSNTTGATSGAGTAYPS